MTTWRLSALFLVVSLLPVSAQDAVQSDPVASLFLSQLQPEQAEKVTPGVLAYSKAARAWWIESRCHVAASQNAGNFADDLAGLTHSVKLLFQSQLGVTPEQAQKYAENIQMFALEQMSATKFYGCGDQAKTVFQDGYAATERIADAARAAQPQK